MDATHEPGAVEEPDAPRTVGAAQPEQDDSIPRRDRPAPAPWTREVPPDDVPDNYVGRPVPARAMSIGRLVVVALLVLYLVGMVVDFVVVATRGEEPQAGMALGMVYGAAIQCGGWWTVIHLIRHR